MARKKTARKKKRSPAQRANDKRLGAMAKKRAAKKRGRKKKAAKKRGRNPSRSSKKSNLCVVFRLHGKSGYVDFYTVSPIWGDKSRAVLFPTQSDALKVARRFGVRGYQFGVAPENITASEITKRADAGKL